jgi:hypothetical protein
MTGPVRERFDEEPDPEPDSYGDGDLDDGAPDCIPSLGDAYDQEQGYPVDVEDIAIVAYESLRAYRISQGRYVGSPCWPRATKQTRDAHMERVQNLLADQIEPTDTDPESRLVAAVVSALAP